MNLRASVVLLTLLLPAAFQRTSRSDSAANAGDLEQTMEGMEKSLDALLLAIEAGSMATDEAVQSEQLALARTAVDSLEAGLLTAYGQAPRVPRTIEDEAARQAFLVRFQRKVLATLDTSLDLELALIEGDLARAGGLGEALVDAEKSGHQEFRPRRERRGPDGPPKGGGGD